MSYIVITWNGIDYLRQLLETMQTQLSRSDVELVITDNNSTDGTIQFIKQFYPQAKLISLSENRGVAYARNAALRQASGKYLFILDNDIQITDEAVASIEKYMDEHANVGICGCKLIYPDGKLQESCKPYPGLFQKIRAFINPSHEFFYKKQLLKNEPFEPCYIIGACQMIRCEMYEQIGSLDETIFYGPEDCDYCLRARSAGWHVIYLPTVYMRHHCQRRTHTSPFSRLGWQHVKALMYFYWKHKKI